MMLLKVRRNEIIKSAIIIKKMSILQEVILSLQKTSVSLDNLYTHN